MAKSTSFACATCGRSGRNPCVVGQFGSAKWLEQIPLHRWHAARVNAYKKQHEEAEG